VVKMLQLWKVVYKEELKIRIDGCISVFLESKTMESEKLGWTSIDRNYLTSSSAQSMNATRVDWGTCSAPT
jgi:hypothetical protein